MREIKYWFRKLFKKKQQAVVKDQRLFKGVLDSTKIDENKTVVSDAASVSLSYEDKIIGMGNTVITNMRVEEDNRIFSTIYDLEIIDGFTINEDTVLTVSYSTIGYNPVTRMVTHDAYMIFNDVRLVNGNEITCHLDNVSSIVNARNDSK